jgi:hypothetical protein
MISFISAVFLVKELASCRGTASCELGIRRTVAGKNFVGEQKLNRRFTAVLGAARAGDLYVQPSQYQGGCYITVLVQGYSCQRRRLVPPQGRLFGISTGSSSVLAQSSLSTRKGATPTGLDG